MRLHIVDEFLVEKIPPQRRMSRIRRRHRLDHVHRSLELILGVLVDRVAGVRERVLPFHVNREEFVLSLDRMNLI